METRKQLAVLQKAKELLNYTNARTKIVSADISTNKFQQALHEISELSDVDQMRDACYTISRSVKNSHKYGFSKQSYHSYGSKMRDSAYEILEGIVIANGINFQTSPQLRIDKISQENCISRMNQDISNQNRNYSNQYPRKYYRNKY